MGAIFRFLGLQLLGLIAWGAAGATVALISASFSLSEKWYIAIAGSIALAGWIGTQILARKQKLPSLLQNPFVFHTALIWSLGAGIPLLILSWWILSLFTGIRLWVAFGGDDWFHRNGWTLWLVPFEVGAVLYLILKRKWVQKWLVKPIGFFVGFLTGFAGAFAIAFVVHILLISFVTSYEQLRATHGTDDFVGALLYFFFIPALLFWPVLFRRSIRKGLVGVLVCWLLVYVLFHAVSERARPLKEARVVESTLLFRLGFHSAIERIYGYAKSSDFEMVGSASSALNDLSSKYEDTELKKFLKSSNSYVRTWAAVNITNTTDKEVVTVLHDAMKNRDPLLRVIAAGALLRRGEKTSGIIQDVILSDADATVRLIGMVLLENSADSTLIRTLFKVMQDRNEELRWPAFVQLQNIGRLAKEEDLLLLLKEKDSYLACFAAWMIDERNIYDDQSHAALSYALKQLQSPVNLIAASVLARRENDHSARALALQNLNELSSSGTVVNQTNPELYPLSMHLSLQILDWFREPKLTGTLLRLLKHKDAAIRGRAAEALGVYGDPASISGLMQSLSDDNEDVREKSVEALGKIADPQAVPQLVERLDDRFLRVREQAAVALERIADPRAVPALAKAAREWRSKSQIIDALAAINDAKAVEAIIDIWKDSVEDNHAAIALKYMEYPEITTAALAELTDRNRNKRMQAISILQQKGGKEVIAALLLRLKDPDELIEVRRTAAMALANLGNPEGLKATADFLSVRRPPKLNTYEIANLDHPESFPALIALLESKDDDIRGYAATALERLGDPRAIPALMDRLRVETHPFTISRIAMALSEFKDKRALPVLIQQFQDRDLPEETRKVVAESIGRLSDPSAFDVMEECLDEKSDILIQGCIQALGEIGDPRAVQDVIAYTITDSTRPAAVTALGHFRDPEAIRILQELYSYDPNVRWQTIQALGRIAHPDGIPTLLKALRMTRSDYRSEGAKALAKIQDARVVPALIVALEDPVQEVRKTAAEALGNISDPAAIPALYKNFRSSRAIFLFNSIRRNLWFSDLATLLNSGDPFVQSAGFYFQATKAREDHDYDQQRKFAATAFQKLGLAGRGLSVLCLLEKANAELNLGLHSEALSTLRQAQQLASRLTKKEEEEYGELFLELTFYWIGEAYSRMEMGSDNVRRAISAYEEAMRRLARRKSESDQALKDAAMRLEPMVRTGLGIVRIREGRGQLQQALELGRNFRTRDAIEMQNEERRYITLAQQKSADGEYEEAQHLIEELSLRRLQYLQKRFELRLADPSKQKVVQEFNARNEEIQQLQDRLAQIRAATEPSSPATNNRFPLPTEKAVPEEKDVEVPGIWKAICPKRNGR